MADIAIGGGQPYTITLDNIELSYLSKYITSNRMEKKPLWTKQTLNGENEYYQVQIDTGNGNENCYSEPSDTYKCHICNIHVPTMYSKEHNNSERHETLKHIFQEVLKRLSKQMNANIFDVDNDVSNIMYFCVTCSKIIKIKNKIKHESSDYHVKTQKDMNVAKEFYKTLQESKELGNGIHLEEDSNPESKFVSQSTPNRHDDTNYTLFKTCSSSSLDSDDEYEDFTIRGSGERVSPSPNDENKAIVNVEVEKLKSFEEYLKEMIKTYNLKANLPIVSGESICLVTPSGNRLNVSSEHFHGYRKLENRVYCQLCKLWVALDTRSHDVTENHVRRIFSPINENFARAIDNVTSHCVPCNDVILTDSDHHSINDNHKKIIKETRVTNAGKTYCNDCNIYLDTHNFNVHTKSKKHLNVLIEKHSISILDHTENIVYCNTCKIPVHKNDLSNHVNSKAHAAKKNDDSTEVNNKTTKVDITNSISTKVNNKCAEVDHTNNISAKAPAIDVVSNPDYCETCKVKVPRGGMKTHVDEKPHKNVLSGLKAENKSELKTQDSKVENAVKALSGIKDNGASTSAIDNVTSHCVPCNDVILTDSDHHSINDNHKKIIKETRVTNAGKTYCDDCNIYIDTHNFNVHTKSKKHLNVVMEKHSISKLDHTENIVYCNTCKISVHKNDLSNHVNSKAHAAKKNDERAKVNNKTTKVDITNNSTKVKNKSAEVDHTNNIPAKANDNSPAIGVVSNPDYCETCKVNVPRGGMITHVNGKPHKKVLSGLKVDNKCDLKTEDNKVENAVKTLSGIKDNGASTSAVSNAQSRRSDSKIVEYYEQLVFTDNTKTKAKCKICYIVINCVESSIIEHMEGKSHVEISNKLKMAEYRKLLIYSSVMTKLKCTICDVHLPLVDRHIIDHMEGQYHEEQVDILLKVHKMKRNQSEFTCECCNIDMKNYFEHINSRKHMLKIVHDYNINKNVLRKYIYELDEGGTIARLNRHFYKIC